MQKSAHFIRVGECKIIIINHCWETNDKPAASPQNISNDSAFLNDDPFNKPIIVARGNRARMRSHFLA